MSLPLVIAGLDLAEGFLGYAGSYSASKAMELQAQGIRLRGEFQAAAQRRNSRVSELQAEEAQARGRKVASDVYRKSRMLRGTQRATAAASGVQVDSGSVADIQDESANLAEQDMLTANNNAWKEAWGFKVQSTDQAFDAEFTKLGAESEAFALEGKAKGTVLAGGMGILSSGIKSYRDFKS